MAQPGACNPTLALPPALARDIFSRLPADERARAACVCPAWRVAVADPALWRRLDLSRGSGVTCRVDDAALRAAAARAQGGLEALNVPLHVYGAHPLSWAALHEVVAANGASLRQLSTLRVGDGNLASLLAAAPALQVLEVNLWCGITGGRPILRNEMPFGPLRVRHLELFLDEPDTDFAAIAAELAAHASLTELTLHGGGFVELPRHTLDAVASFVVACGRPTKLALGGWKMSPAAAPALARLLSSPALTELKISSDTPLLDAHAAVLLSAALRANATLGSLCMCGVDLYDDIPAALELLGALTGHASLRSLYLSRNMVGTRAAAAALVGAALGALVSADTLEELDISCCDLGDAGLAPLCDALPRTTRLRELELWNNGASAAFWVQRLLPAVRANTSLRQLETRDVNLDRSYTDDGEPEEAKQAARLVAAREAARVAAAAEAAGGA
jgi:hypothetical protein